MKRIATLMIASILIMMNPEYSLACSCSGQSSVLDAVKSSDIVFNGVVVSKTTTTDLLKYGVNIVGNPNATSYTEVLANIPLAVFKIQVLKIYKGKSSTETISIITAATSASCGIPFQIGEKYIIYGTSHEYSMSNSYKRSFTNNKTYWTHRCSRTSYFSKDEDKAIKRLK